jgi:outer membrane protein
MAIKNHPQVLRSRVNSLRSDQLVREQRSAYYPSISGDVTGSAANQDARIGAGFLTDSALFNRFGYGLTLSQLVTDSGRTPNLVASGRLRAEASREAYEATKDDIALGVEQDYFGVLLAKSLVQVAQETVSARQSVVDQVSELTRNKLKSQLDLSFADVNLSDAKLMVLRAQNNLRGAFATLGDAIGSQQSTSYQLADQPMPAAPEADAEPLVVEAFAHRPELAGLRLEKESNERFARAEHDLKRPTVSLTAVAGMLPYINTSSLNSNVAQGYTAAAVNVQIPVFNGHLFTARATAAEYDIQASDQRIREVQDRIARDVRVAWGRTQTAHEAITATDRLLQQANSSLDLAQGRYKLGLSSIVELSQAQLAQTQAQVQNLSAKYEYQEAYAGLQYTLGLLH